MVRVYVHMVCLVAVGQALGTGGEEERAACGSGAPHSMQQHSAQRAHSAARDTRARARFAPGAMAATAVVIDRLQGLVAAEIDREMLLLLRGRPTSVRAT